MSKIADLSTLQAALTLKDYCTKTDCDKCVLRKLNTCYGSNAGIYEVPTNWQLEDQDVVNFSNL